MAWLDDNPPARSQFRTGRRSAVTGAIVIHTAENLADEVGPDTGAENVANFIKNRSTAGSYHVLVDSDSAVRMVEFTNEAFHVRGGGNAWSLGLSFATQASKWAQLQPDWAPRAVIRAGFEAARMAEWVRATTGIVVPAKRITLAQFNAGVPGFISHAMVDPDRRTDPGPLFSWEAFLNEFEKSMRLLSKQYPINDGDPALVLGDSGPGTEVLQRVLNERHDAGLTVDGDFGPLTRTAVLAAEDQMGVTLDGIWSASDARASFTFANPPAPPPVVDVAQALVSLDKARAAQQATGERVALVESVLDRQAHDTAALLADARALVSLANKVASSAAAVAVSADTSLAKARDVRAPFIESEKLVAEAVEHLTASES